MQKHQQPDPAEAERKPGRYFITEPVPGGYGWWDVRLPDGPRGPNFSLVSIWRECPGAGPLAHEICDRLNGTPKPNAALEELLAAAESVLPVLSGWGLLRGEHLRAAIAKCREVLK